jgi:hypothetical protein
MSFFGASAAASAVRLGRHTAFLKNNGQPFVVVLIGARVNSWRALYQHFGAVRQAGMYAANTFAAPDKDVEIGLLYQQKWGHMFLGAGSLSVQYWCVCALRSCLFCFLL